MPFGDILADFREIELEDAEENNFKIKNNFISRMGFKVIGIPHIGMRIRARLILNEFKKVKGKKIKILDAGCGFGIYSFTLKKKGFEVYSIDCSEKRIHFLKGNGIKNAQVMDIAKLNFKNNFFDAIVCSDVVEHVKNYEKAFSELSRVLKKGGRLLLTLPNLSLHNILTYKKFYHIKPGYSKEDIERFARENNFKIEKLRLYSSYLGEFAFDLNRTFYKNKILLGILFYPIYSVALLEKFFKFKKESYNGLFVSLVKNS